MECGSCKDQLIERTLVTTGCCGALLCPQCRIDLLFPTCFECQIKTTDGKCSGCDKSFSRCPFCFQPINRDDTFTTKTARRAKVSTDLGYILSKIKKHKRRVSELIEWYHCDNFEEVKEYFLAEMKAIDLYGDTLTCIRDHLRIYPGWILVPVFRFVRNTVRMKWLNRKITVHHIDNISKFIHGVKVTRDGKNHGYCQLDNELSEYRDGVLIKQFEYKVGTMARERTYVDGKIHLDERFDRNGIFSSRTTYFVDSVLFENVCPRTETVKDLEGKIIEARQWHDNGQLLFSVNRDGTRRDYSSNGTMCQLSVPIPDGRHIQSFDHTGAPAFDHINTPDGRMRTFHSNGRIARESKMCRYVRHGIHREFDTDGGLTKWAEYRDGKLEGLYQVWVGEQLVLLSTYQDGKREGWYRMWWSNGRIREEGHFLHDENIGIFREWKEEGGLEKEPYPFPGIPCLTS